jgi:hypothetical protein
LEKKSKTPSSSDKGNKKGMFASKRIFKIPEKLRRNDGKEGISNCPNVPTVVELVKKALIPLRKCQSIGNTLCNGDGDGIKATVLVVLESKNFSFLTLRECPAQK